MEYAADAVYRICVYLGNQLARRENDRCGYPDNRGTDEPSYLLYEHSDESHDALHGVRYDHNEYGERETYHRSVK